MESRFETMSLGSRGAATIPNRARRWERKESNKTADIEGAKPELRYTRYTSRRPDLFQTCDIDGSRSLQLHKHVFRVQEPVEGSAPRRTQFKTSRCVDPLDPAYELPSCTPAAALVPKFVRDAADVRDIDGTAPRPRFRFKQRETHGCADVEGARSDWRPRNERARRDAPTTDLMFDVRDINNVSFKTSRTTDPLRPKHKVNGMCIEDDLVKTMPRKLPKARNGPFLPLSTHDIEGAQCGWKPTHTVHPPLEDRRHFRNTNFIGDIEGTQPDSVKHAIRTTRQTNPLNPRYKSLDGDALQDPTVPDFSHLLAASSRNKKPPPKSAPGPATMASTSMVTSASVSGGIGGGAAARHGQRGETRAAKQQLQADIAAVRALPK